MDEYISPIDRHRHFGDAGRAECAVCRLEAERGRLRAVVSQVMSRAAMVNDTDTIDFINAALDGSADIGGETCPDCGNPLRFCDCPDREPLLCDNCGQPLAEHLGLLSCRDEG